MSIQRKWPAQVWNTDISNYYHIEGTICIDILIGTNRSEDIATFKIVTEISTASIESGEVTTNAASASSSTQTISTKIGTGKSGFRWIVWLFISIFNVFSHGSFIVTATVQLSSDPDPQSYWNKKCVVHLHDQRGHYVRCDICLKYPEIIKLHSHNAQIPLMAAQEGPISKNGFE